MVYLGNYSSPVGDIVLGSDGENLIGLWFKDQKYFLGSIKEDTVQKDDLIIFDETRKWLDKYFNGEKPLISDLPITPSGSDFRKSVWKILCEIPYGKVITYNDIAKEIDNQKGIEHMSAQAVGGAVSHNPISIIIPCHRVVGSKGSLTGYAGGIDKKIKLLEHEKVDMSNLFIPKKGTAL
ncbi:methylated-DNA--[protein]-cysteine S-methyltransferase [Anaerofustis stercorihominis]|uniref:Methylated-DNA--protein-cysteine methyltransferase n=1 Tax=Anaerofustis stercorihominis TaxID=214853 RepID=A0A3E3E012_9FIRM|nr:methylated-DNA--[protein]-cysteine S-methyltransferase [Anaerofustis stercorihominis]RGD74278.1 methylated-DNA--[protein]-cysteine S-methyltransferase [Anaerofustis stercorihominis]